NATRRFESATIFGSPSGIGTSDGSRQSTPTTRGRVTMRSSTNLAIGPVCDMGCDTSITYRLPILARAHPQVSSPNLQIIFLGQENGTNRTSTPHIEHAHTRSEMQDLTQGFCQPEHIGSHQMIEHPPRVIGG